MSAVKSDLSNLSDDDRDVKHIRQRTMVEDRLFAIMVIMVKSSIMKSTFRCDPLPHFFCTLSWVGMGNWEKGGEQRVDINKEKILTMFRD